MDPLAADLRRYLQEERESVLASLSGLSDYDIRRPMTPTGTNLLGLVKHLAGIELGYLGDCVGRPSPVRLPWVEDESVWDNADMWATADQSKDYLVGLYRKAWQPRRVGRRTRAGRPGRGLLVARGPAGDDVGSLLVRVVAETAQHAGHATSFAS